MHATEYSLRERECFDLFTNRNRIWVRWIELHGQCTRLKRVVLEHALLKRGLRTASTQNLPVVRIGRLEMLTFIGKVTSNAKLHMTVEKGVPFGLIGWMQPIWQVTDRKEEVKGRVHTHGILSQPFEIVLRFVQQIPWSSKVK